MTKSMPSKSNESTARIVEPISQVEFRRRLPVILGIQIAIAVFAGALWKIGFSKVSFGIQLASIIFLLLASIAQVRSPRYSATKLIVGRSKDIFPHAKTHIPLMAILTIPLLTPLLFIYLARKEKDSNTPRVLRLSNSKAFLFTGFALPIFIALIFNFSSSANIAPKISFWALQPSMHALVLEGSHFGRLAKTATEEFGRFSTGQKESRSVDKLSYLNEMSPLTLVVVLAKASGQKNAPEDSKDRVIAGLIDHYDHQATYPFRFNPLILLSPASITEMALLSLIELCARIKVGKLLIEKTNGFSDELKDSLSSTKLFKLADTSPDTDWL